MTQQKSLKRRVRARMDKTGERYTAARRNVLAKAPADDSTNVPATPEEAPTPTPAVAPTAADVPATLFRGDRRNSDEVLVHRTGRPWADWFTLLTDWGAADRPHPDIARWLNAEQGVDGWWAQELTVSYEMAIGRRVPGQRPDGFSITGSKTVAVPVERIYAAFVDDAVRAQWLPGAGLRLRTATPHRTARFDWEDGASRLAVGFTAKDPTRSTAALEHSKLPDQETADRMKRFWRERLQVLQQLLEG